MLPVQLVPLVQSARLDLRVRLALLVRLVQSGQPAPLVLRALLVPLVL